MANPRRIASVLLCAVALAACADAVTAPNDVVRARPTLQQNPAAAVKVDRRLVAQYARENWNRVYGSGSGQNPFCSYAREGGDCTNFGSQSILAGLVKSTNPATLYSKRREYHADRYSNGTRWYYENCKDKAPAWAGAHQLYQYASGNRPSYAGLHFMLVTFDTPTKFMEYGRVEPGDIIFADWENDGRFDHTMVVVSYDARPWWQTQNSGYNRVRVAYQNSSNNQPRGDVGLGDINIAYKYKAVFHVYRPLDYNPTGL
jgi:hypothetical protein